MARTMTSPIPSLTAADYAAEVSALGVPMAHQVALRLARSGRIPGAVPVGTGRRRIWQFPQPTGDPRLPRGRPRNAKIL